MRNRFIGVIAFALVGGASWVSGGGCTTRDCAEERAGQVRCVANRAELCEADGSLSYTSCTVNRLVCSEQHGGCVTEEVVQSTSSSGGGGTGGVAVGGNGGAGADGGAGANGGAGASGGSSGGSGGTAGAGG